MNKPTTNDLVPLEHYAKQRNDFRAKVIEHKCVINLHSSH